MDTSLNMLSPGVHKTDRIHCGYKMLKDCREKISWLDWFQGKEPRYFPRCIGRAMIPVGSTVVVSCPVAAEAVRTSHMQVDFLVADNNVCCDLGKSITADKLWHEGQMEKTYVNPSRQQFQSGFSCSSMP